MARNPGWGWPRGSSRGSPRRPSGASSPPAPGTPLFFGLHLLGVAFAEILLLWAAIAATLVAFFRVSRSAGWLLAPYLAWVGFAAILNFTLWSLNP